MTGSSFTSRVAFILVSLFSAVACREHRPEPPPEAQPSTSTPPSRPPAPRPPMNTPGRPAERDHLVAQARLKIADGNRKKAIALLERAIEVGPETADVRVLLGECRMNERQDLDGAEREFARAVELEPGRAEPHVRLAELRLLRADPEGARREAIRALELEPDHPRAQIMVAEIWRREGRWEEAMELLERHLAKHPRSAAGYRERAALHLVRGELDRAIADLNRAIERDPVDTSARWSLATALRRAGRAEEADRALQEFELLSAIFSPSLHDLEPDAHKREAILLQIRERLPSLWQAWLELARVRSQLRGNVAARDTLDQAVRRFPDVPILRTSLAEILEALGDRRGAEYQRGEAERLQSAADAEES